MYGVYRLLCEDRFWGIESWATDELTSIAFTDLCILSWSRGGVYRVVSDMTGIESSDFQIDKFITLVKSCQVSMSCTTCLQWLDKFNAY